MAAAGIGCACPPSISTLATNATAAVVCTACGAFRCSRCAKTHTCCTTKRHVHAGTIIANTLGPAILSCSRGCVGDAAGHGPTCARKRKPAVIEHDGFRIETRAKKRWKIVEAPLRRGCVWHVRSTADDGVRRSEYVIVGPALPGTLVPTCAHENVRIATVATTTVVPCAAGWAPEETFAGVGAETWRACAKSPCAWARFVHKRPPAKKVAVVPPHTAVDVGAPAEQLPPAYSKTPRGTIVCAYCARAFASAQKYAEVCAPDVICDAEPSTEKG